MKPLRVTYASGMVNIDCDDISFSWIPGMYQDDRAGIGLQINSHVNGAKAQKMCIKIAEAVSEFNGKEAP